jgi:glycosyltransferase involved in cell wall biosynthesis
MFIGKFIPLHGIEKIIETAGILKSEIDIIFTLVGLGQLRSEIEKKIKEQGLNNVRLMDWIPYNQLSQKMAEADLLLGIFGDSDKAKRVIPNKLFQALAVRKPALTADTPAIRELLTPDEHIFTSEPTPDKIAEKIRFIRTNKKNSYTVSINGHRFFHEKLSIEKLGAELKTILKDA